MAKNWIGSAIKHPGIEQRKAKANGISTHQQLERDAHSSNPTDRARGNLGLRFEKGGDLHKGGRGSSERSSAGPREESADRKGDEMRPMTPSPISPRNTGRGHMGSWADREHPVGRK